MLISMVMVGRVWRGFMCPEGTLTEAASRHGLKRAIPRWVRWGGWPFVAFALTTIYGQMTSVYQYPGPVLLILGGSTVAAIIAGLLWGEDKRVWCRFLCPVNGVFRVLAKLAPLHFAVDTVQWNAYRLPPGDKFQPVRCAPLMPIRTMASNSNCHMCGNCSGFRGGAVKLALRSPNHDIVNVAGLKPKPWKNVLIVFGLLGVAIGAFLWSASPWLVKAKIASAGFLVSHGLKDLLHVTLPWWILTDYPQRNDVLTLLDGGLLIAFILAFALVNGAVVSVSLAAASLASGWSVPRFHHFAQALIPLAGAGMFLGFSALTVTLLAQDGLRLGWVDEFRIAMLAGAAAWSLWLGWRIACVHAPNAIRRGLALVALLSACLSTLGSWYLLFWIW
ncbi:MAG: 4Fe-4S binding protein [Aestuariivirga sp.]|uniref:4Fe-4S binding protein n=1 Tax=Aestuariivirga sp. TaxID=2650926 RepID=UPI0030185BEE